MEPLPCVSCGRPFSSVAAVERHRLRCRFRPRSRKKACTECSRSKVRCDQRMPTCSRCAIHSLPCAYPQTGQPGVNPDQPVLGTSSSSSDTPYPLTPSPDLSQSSWMRAVSQKTQVVDPSALFSGTEWTPGRDAEWPSEALALVNEGCSSGEGPPRSVPAATTDICDHQPLPHNQTTDPFQNLSTYLFGKWTSAEHGLDFIDQSLKGHVDGFATGSRRPPFIHFRNWDEARRPLALIETAVVAQLYVTRTPHSDIILIRSIDTQLIQIQRNMLSHTRADDVATMQTALLCAGMRIYRAGPTASECIDRVSLRLMQHVLSKSLHAMTPHSNISAQNWDSWIQDESIRRCFFTLHCLDYVTHARQSLPNVLCALFPDAPLPCPLHIWEAPTAEEWALRYGAWEEYCGAGSPLTSRDLLCWVQGKVTGREEQLRVWFQGVDGELGGLVFECVRAQARTAGVTGLL